MEQYWVWQHGWLPWRPARAHNPGAGVGRRRAVDRAMGGEYGSRESGRTGSILFTLEAGSDTARGDVLMVPREWELPPQPRPGDPEAMSGRYDRPAQSLPIAFVHAMDGTVEGRLAPYRDPDCGCMLTTVFTGRLVDPNTFEGRFVSIHRETGHEARGWWRVRRRVGVVRSPKRHDLLQLFPPDIGDDGVSSRVARHQE